MGENHMSFYAQALAKKDVLNFTAASRFRGKLDSSKYLSCSPRSAWPYLYRPHLHFYYDLLGASKFMDVCG